MSAWDRQRLWSTPPKVRKIFLVRWNSHPPKANRVYLRKCKMGNGESRCPFFFQFRRREEKSSTGGAISLRLQYRQGPAYDSFFRSRESFGVSLPSRFPLGR